MIDPAQLRRHCRRARRSLGASEQLRHSRAFAALMRRQRAYRSARSIAAYMAADGELDPAPLLATLQRQRKRLYLPVLRPHPQRKLWFLHHPPGGALRRNRFGIGEPPLKHQHIRLPWALDLVLMPLVGFDAECNRLGMGGGFYDRTLAYLKHRQKWRRPLLVGIAHECQKVAELPLRHWDVPLDMVVTEAAVYRRQPSTPANSR